MSEVVSSVWFGGEEMASAPVGGGGGGYNIGQNFTSALAIGGAAIVCTFALLGFYFCRSVSIGRRQEESAGEDSSSADAVVTDHRKLRHLPVFGLDELGGKRIKGGGACAVCLGDLGEPYCGADDSTTTSSAIATAAATSDEMGRKKAEQRLRLLPECGHCFHCECVDGWIKLHMLCPVCRASLVEDEQKPNADDERGDLEIVIDRK